MAYSNPLFELIIPEGAGPGDPRIVISTGLPAPLDTYVFKDSFGDPATAIAAILFYGGSLIADNSYGYIALIPSFNDDLMIHMGSVMEGIMQEAAVNYPNGYQWITTLGGLFYMRLFSEGSRLNIGNIDTNLYRGAADQLKTDDMLLRANEAHGSVLITPSAANVPTSVTVSGLSVLGSTFYGYATPNTSVPGTQVTGVGVTAPASTGLVVWLTRTNTTATTVYWRLVGE